MYLEMNFRNGFGFDVEVVDRLPLGIIADENNNVEGIYVLEGLVVSLPFLVIYAGSERSVGAINGDEED